ncbi:hypothetical protein PP175_19705 [Aneurinibacillus sp. Ricciae_BoGa-3]|uniref:hypothetical protein n=1 Tax=Aneurinibacillus sp. Ricciae_BoGa-3 TaxID=3022697 RepID=UPI0023401F1A|nr:hypothetical protein [Aneurinibacillus sp. Ricciae_BoGa-3]WCK53540.1 hypothetical protein PP175_19705 [Aneurinibacillus sp. Ricciae_BoGa-3]
MMKQSFIAKRSTSFLIAITVISILIFSGIFIIMLSILNALPPDFHEEWLTRAAVAVLIISTVSTLFYYRVRKRKSRRRRDEKGSSN